jgi:glutamine synthetase
MPKTVADALAMAAKVQMVDLRFTDLPGVWQHFTIPSHILTEETFEDGVPFDGSSIRGFKEIHESDMLLMLDATTAFVDPIYQVPTMVIMGDVYDPITREPYSRDPRYIARRAETYLQQTGIGDTVYFRAGGRVLHLRRRALRLEHKRGVLPHRQPRGLVEQRQGPGAELWRQIAAKRGYFPTPPTDTLQDVRSRIVLAWKARACPVEIHHHEVASAGQGEIGMRFGTLMRWPTA